MNVNTYLLLIAVGGFLTVGWCLNLLKRSRGKRINRRKLNVEDFCSNINEKEVAIKNWLHFSQGHIMSAEKLFNERDIEFYDSIAVLIHFGFEQFFKACLCYEKNSFEATHDLIELKEQINIQEIKKILDDDEERKKVLKQVDSMFCCRYPMTNAARNMLNSSIGEKQRMLQAGEIGSEVIEEAFDLYDELIEQLSGKMRSLFDSLDIAKKGRRRAMRKPIEPSLCLGVF